MNPVSENYIPFPLSQRVKCMHYFPRTPSYQPTLFPTNAFLSIPTFISSCSFWDPLNLIKAICWPQAWNYPLQFGGVISGYTPEVNDFPFPSHIIPSSNHKRLSTGPVLDRSVRVTICCEFNIAAAVQCQRNGSPSSCLPTLLPASSPSMFPNLKGNSIDILFRDGHPTITYSKHHEKPWVCIHCHSVH